MAPLRRFLSGSLAASTRATAGCVGIGTVVIAAALALALASPAAAAPLPDTLAAVVPSVVAVGTFRATDSPRFGFRGSGFAVGDGNTVVTNFHVLPQAADGTAADAPLMVHLPRQRGDAAFRNARVLATDRVHDLTLLRIDGPALPALTLAPAELAREGSAIAFTGFPIGGVLGFAPVTHQGIVSSVVGVAQPAATAQQLGSRSLGMLRDGAFEIYQLDAVAYPGNSGGPVFDVASGQVLGVINMVLARAGRESALSNPTGVSYAIPVRFVRELLDRR